METISCFAHASAVHDRKVVHVTLYECAGPAGSASSEEVSYETGYEQQSLSEGNLINRPYRAAEHELLVCSVGTRVRPLRRWAGVAPPPAQREARPQGPSEGRALLLRQ